MGVGREGKGKERSLTQQHVGLSDAVEDCQRDVLTF